jgi:hypothetical protein
MDAAATLDSDRVIVDDENDDGASSSSTSSSTAIVVVASSLRTRPSRRFHLTRRGRILQSTTERYLRDDLGYGTMLVPSSSSNSNNKGKDETIAGKIVRLIPWTIEDESTLRGVLASAVDEDYDHHDDDAGGGGGTILRLAVVDANVLLHHMDVLEYLRDDDDDVHRDNDRDRGGARATTPAARRRRHRAVADAIVIPQTALEECRHRSLVMYGRATDLVRSGGGGGSTRRGGGGDRRHHRRPPVIVFADAHHADTQIRPPGGGGVPPPYFDDADAADDDAMTTTTTTINDENDARIRGVALFYGRALSRDDRDRSTTSTTTTTRRRKVEVVFLSDDAASRKMALLDDGGRKYVARSVREHVTMLQKEDPTLNLLDVVAHFGGAAVGPSRAPPAAGVGTTTTTTTTTTTATAPYDPHVASSDLSRGLRSGRYHQGTYRSDRDSYAGGYVTLRRGEDRVAVELLPVELWPSASDESDDREGGGGRTTTASVARAGIAADTAEPTVHDIENIAEGMTVDDGGRTLRRPAGRVVGIIRRNFHRNFCGSICTVDDAKRDGDGTDDGDDVVDGVVDDEDEGTERPVHPHDVIAARHEREHADGITSTVVFFSIDQRVPPILLRTTQRERLVGMRILVSMDSWPADSEFPLGHYVRTLGVAGTKDTETQVLLQEFRIPCEPFPAKVGFCCVLRDI